jgi:thiamine-monophosphate kinase
MSLSEFDLIREYFSNQTWGREDVALGVGDDCALLRPPAGMELVVTSDTLVEGVHFQKDADPEALGHKSLAVNLSDLAAMGADPAWVTLALTIPETDSAWLRAFSNGFLSLARKHDVALIGGDTTQGPLSITVTAQGFVQPGSALMRSGAKAGDLIYVSGSIGDASLALLARQGGYVVETGMKELEQRLDRPQPRLAVGRFITQIASSAIDISDGLIADLGHICEQSSVGARVLLDKIPLTPQVSDYLQLGGSWDRVIAGGDDYELCFTVPKEKIELLNQSGTNLECRLTQIGELVSEPGVSCIMGDGTVLENTGAGYQHFSDVTT